MQLCRNKKIFIVTKNLVNKNIKHSFTSMITIKNYSPIDFNDLQKKAREAREKNKKSNVELCSELNLRSIVTINNGLALDIQKVSDEKLTKLHKLLGIDSLVVYENGERKYFFKK